MSRTRVPEPTHRGEHGATASSLRPSASYLYIVRSCNDNLVHWQTKERMKILSQEDFRDPGSSCCPSTQTGPAANNLPIEKFGLWKVKNFLCVWNRNVSRNERPTEPHPATYFVSHCPWHHSSSLDCATTRYLSIVL